MNDVKSVGLASRLINLAANHYIKNQSPNQVIIDNLLGTGESYGEAAVHWMFDRINQPHIMKQFSTSVNNFTFKRKVDFTP